MKNTKNPQAYPTLFYNQTTGEPNGHDAGMTLRDYFAGLALQALITKGGEHILDAPEQAYYLADKMLKQRENETI